MKRLLALTAAIALAAGALLSHGSTATAVCLDSYCPTTPFPTSPPFPPGGTTSTGTQPPVSTATVPSGCGSTCR